MNPIARLASFLAASVSLSACLIPISSRAARQADANYAYETGNNDGMKRRPDTSWVDCMGDGYAGDACWFGSDCMSGSCDSTARECK